jgi:hypothetical protein
VDEDWGQQWAAALGPYITRVTADGVVFERRLVYCHTSQMSHGGVLSWTKPDENGRRYPSRTTPAWCNVFDVAPSWKRCSRCPKNHGFTTLPRGDRVPDFRKLKLLVELPFDD